MVKAAKATSTLSRVPLLIKPVNTERARASGGPGLGQPRPVLRSLCSSCWDEPSKPREVPSRSLPLKDHTVGLMGRG